MRLDEYLQFADVLDDKKEIGIEVEMEGDNLPGGGNFWRVEHDPSLRGNSLEYALKHPCQRRLAAGRVDGLYAAFKEIGSDIQPSNRCGVHIHINCRPMSISEIWNFAILYLIFEDILMHWCGDDREGNLFCLRMKDAEWLLVSLIKDRMAGGFDKTLSIKNFKYASINFSTLLKYGSLEFRGLGTPPKPQRIKDWIGMLLKIKDYALTVTNPTEFIGAASQNGSRQFLSNVFNEYADLLQQPDLERQIMAGVRRIQALAFTPFKEAKKAKYQLPKWVDPFGGMVAAANEPAEVRWAGPPPDEDGDF